MRSRTPRRDPRPAPPLSDAQLLGQARHDLAVARKRRKMPVASDGWMCSACRRADLGLREHPGVDAHHAGDCTCACGFTGIGT